MIKSPTTTGSGASTPSPVVPRQITFQKQKGGIMGGMPSTGRCQEGMKVAAYGEHALCACDPQLWELLGTRGVSCMSLHVSQVTVAGTVK